MGQAAANFVTVRSLLNAVLVCTDRLKLEKSLSPPVDDSCVSLLMQMYVESTCYNYY